MAGRGLGDELGIGLGETSLGSGVVGLGVVDGLPFKSPMAPTTAPPASASEPTAMTSTSASA